VARECVGMDFNVCWGRVVVSLSFAGDCFLCHRARELHFTTVNPEIGKRILLLDAAKYEVVKAMVCDVEASRVWESWLGSYLSYASFY
jgi:hypothetical protein